jgi:hypothetical protein
MAHQVSHVCHGVVIQLQSSGDGIEDLIRRIVFSALLKPEVVVGTYTREYCHFFPAQASDPAAPACGETDVGGLDQAPTGAQKLRQRRSLRQGG